jgi:hypothetical protein
MRLTYAGIIGTLIAMAASGCFTGTSSPIQGISGGDTTGSGTPPVLSFAVQPNSANVDQAISPPVQVIVRDSTGGTDSSFTGTISVALASNATGATLGGTTSVRPVDGIASFSNLAVNKAGTYTLSASASGAATVTSSAFPVTQ